MTRRLLALLRRFRRSTRGAILVETLLVVPVVVIFAVGVAEFGSIFWQRHQLQAGVRDAARYMARCPNTYDTCVNTARNIAFFGTPSPQMTDPQRVRGWYGSNASDLSFQPDTGQSFEALKKAGGVWVITATGRATYTGSPIFGLLGIAGVPFSYSHQERFIGW